MTSSHNVIVLLPENILRTLESAGFHNTAERKWVYLSVHDAVMDALATNWDNDAEVRIKYATVYWIKMNGTWGIDVDYCTVCSISRPLSQRWSE